MNYLRTVIACMTLVMAVHAQADNRLSVGDVSIKAGGTAELIVSLENDADFHVYAYDFRLYLPEGIDVAYDLIGEGEDAAKFYNCELKERNNRHNIEVLETSDDGYLFGVNSSSLYLLGTEGEVLGIRLKTTGLASGTYQGRITTITYADKDGNTVHPDDITFNIIVNEDFILDENSTFAPEASDGAVDVVLYRTIKGGEWSTIVLPFDATAEQVKAAFGDDVELATFTAWTSQEDEDGAIVGIDVSFATATDITANTPMLIKTTADVTTATFDGVTIEPEAEPMVQVGRKASERGYFHGTYIPAKVPAENLFLSGNKFWYSTGKTNIKGYRGYFEFRDVLDAYYDAAAVKVNLFIDGAATHIDQMVNGQSVNGKWYDLSGRQMVNGKWSNGQISKGVYIVNGKKVIK